MALDFCLCVKLLKFLKISSTTKLISIEMFSQFKYNKIFEMITIAEQVMPTSVEGAGSWWNQNPPASVAIPVTFAPLEPRPPVTSKIQPIGGARAQNRFSGRTAKPIFRSVPLDGAPKTVTGADSQPASQPKKSWRLPQRGNTCDGSTISDTINSSTTTTTTTPTATATASRWKFNLDAWRWEVATDVAAGEKLAAQYHISARRWGDGRDALGAAATTKTTATTATKRSVEVVETLGSTKRRALLQVDISGRGGDSSLCEGFSSVGGFEKQKQVLIREIVYPLKHAALCKKVGTLLFFIPNVLVMFFF